MKTDTDADLPQACSCPALALWSYSTWGRRTNDATIAQDPNMKTFARWWYNRLVQSFGTIVWFNRLVQSVHLSVAAL